MKDACIESSMSFNILILIILLLIAVSSISFLMSVSFAVSNTPTPNSINEQESTIRIFQQDMFNLNRTLTQELVAQNYVLSLDISGNYMFDTLDRRLTIDNSSFSGTLFGIENLAAMHEPQIQMMLDNIHNFTVSSDLKMINYDATFVDQKNNSSLTARIAGTLQLQNPIAVYDKVIERQNAIRNSSMMNVTLGTVFLNPVTSGMEINEISIN